MTGLLYDGCAFDLSDTCHELSPKLVEMLTRRKHSHEMRLRATSPLEGRREFNQGESASSRSTVLCVDDRGLVDMYGFSGSTVPGDAAATARHIMADELTYRIGILTDFLTLLLFVFLSGVMDPADENGWSNPCNDVGGTMILGLNIAQRAESRLVHWGRTLWVYRVFA
jgi:hypothetical protein